MCHDKQIFPVVDESALFDTHLNILVGINSWNLGLLNQQKLFVSFTVRCCKIYGECRYNTKILDS